MKRECKGVLSIPVLFVSFSKWSFQRSRGGHPFVLVRAIDRVRGSYGVVEGLRRGVKGRGRVMVDCGAS